MISRRISALSPVEPIRALLVDRLRRRTSIRLDWSLSIERFEEDHNFRSSWVFVFRARDVAHKPSQPVHERVYRSPKVYEAEFGSFSIGGFKPTGSADDLATWIHEDILRSCPDYLREYMAPPMPRARVDVDEYAVWTRETAVNPYAGNRHFSNISYLSMGLASEAGEVLGKVKKILRGDHGEINKVMAEESPTIEAIKAELGDVLWYLCRLAMDLGITPSELAALNQTKLLARKERGSITGSGDNR